MTVERDDAALLARLRETGLDSEAGRRAAAELYARHYDTVMAQAYRITGDRFRAEDYAAEAFAKTLRAMKGGRGPKDSFVGYVLIAMRTEAIRAVPHEKQTHHMEPDEMGELPQLVESDHAGRVSEQDHLVRAFQTLPELQQQALCLLEVEARSIEDAAGRLNTNPTALRALSYRARESLRTAYLQQYVEEARPGCAEYARLLAGYTRDGLGKRQLKRVSDHLAKCATCDHQAMVLTEINSRLRLWLGPLLLGGGIGAAAVAAGGTVDPALAATQAAPAELGRAGATEPQRLWWRLGLAAAVLIVVAGAGITIAFSGGSRPDPESPAAPAQPVAPERAPVHESTPAPQVGEDPAADPPPTQPEESRVVQDDATPFWKIRE